MGGCRPASPYVARTLAIVIDGTIPSNGKQIRCRRFDRTAKGFEPNELDLSTLAPSVRNSRLHRLNCLAEHRPGREQLVDLGDIVARWVAVVDALVGSRREGRAVRIHESRLRR